MKLSAWYIRAQPYDGLSNIIGRMRTPVREAFSYGIRHGTRHIHCDSMKHKVILH